MTIPPALTMLPWTGRVTVTVPCPLLEVVVLVPPACTIWAPARLEAGMVIIPVDGDHCLHLLYMYIYMQSFLIVICSFTLLQDGAICIYRLVDNGLSVSGLGKLLTLQTDLLALQENTNRTEGTLRSEEHTSELQSR